MQAILYIGHGTRRAKGVAQAIRFFEHTMRYRQEAIQEIAFLELAAPSIPEGIATCVKKGATAIAIVPLLLIKASHAKSDIPALIAEAKQRYPFITFTQSEPLGHHPLLIETLHTTITKQTALPQHATILLVGRGSSDDAAVVHMQQVARQLTQRYSLHIIPCFLYGKGLRFEQAIASLHATSQKIVIVPYLLFAGLLSKHITQTVANLPPSAATFIRCDALGQSENIHLVLHQRIDEALQPLKEVSHYG